MKGERYVDVRPAQDCPLRPKHTPAPGDYLLWHEWAEKKAKTHEQEQCPGCGLWMIWVRKKPAVERGEDGT